MEKSLDELIEFLLAEIVVCGAQGEFLSLVIRNSGEIRPESVHIPTTIQIPCSIKVAGSIPR